MDNHQNTSNHAESQLSIGQTVEVLVREFPDVTVSSLRFLESEGLISPVRNTGGHRVFSQQDVLRIRRIKQLQADRVPLKEIRKRMQRSLAVRDLESVVEEVTSLLLDGNIAEAVIRLEDVHLADTPLLTLFDDVLTPVLRNLGDEEGNHLIPVDMQFEFDEQLISLIARITVMPAQILGRPVVLAACPPWERHDLPLRMLVALLKERGASVHFIGAQVESEFARDANERLRPDVIMVSLTVPPSRTAHRWFDELVKSMTAQQEMYIGGMGATLLNIPDATNVHVLGLPSYAEMIRRIYSGSVGREPSSGKQ